jgi:hypothetical protein
MPLGSPGSEPKRIPPTQAQSSVLPQSKSVVHSRWHEGSSPGSLSSVCKQCCPDGQSPPQASPSCPPAPSPPEPSPAEPWSGSSGTGKHAVGTGRCTNLPLQCTKFEEYSRGSSHANGFPAAPPRPALPAPPVAAPPTPPVAPPRPPSTITSPPTPPVTLNSPPAPPFPPFPPDGLVPPEPSPTREDLPPHDVTPSCAPPNAARIAQRSRLTRSSFLETTNAPRSTPMKGNIPGPGAHATRVVMAG